MKKNLLFLRLKIRFITPNAKIISILIEIPNQI